MNDEEEEGDEAELVENLQEEQNVVEDKSSADESATQSSQVFEIKSLGFMCDIATRFDFFNKPFISRNLIVKITIYTHTIDKFIQITKKLCVIWAKIAS